MVPGKLRWKLTNYAKVGMLDTPIAAQYKTKENAYRENSDLRKPREKTLLARALGGRPDSPSKLPHNDAVVHGLSRC